MALNKTKLDPTGSGSRGVGAIAVYDAGADLAATVEAANYFNSAASELAKAPVILVQYATGQRVFYAVTIAAGVVTLADLSAKTLAAGFGVRTLPFFFNLADIANGDLVTNYVPGYAFKILSVDWRTVKPATTAAKAATINLEIETTNLSGGAVALTSANCTPAGAAVAGSAVTAANTGLATESFSIEASGVTAFVEGNGFLLVKIQNLDEVAAAD